MPKRPQDRYANIAAASVTESGVSTITFAELLTGISLGAGVGILIDAIDFYVAKASMAEFTTATDAIEMAWCVSNNVPALSDPSENRIIFAHQLFRFDFGVAASAQYFSFPIHRDFFPPLIVAAPRIYLAAEATGLASACTVRSRLFFRYVDLETKEYLEIAEAFILVG